MFDNDLHKLLLKNMLQHTDRHYNFNLSHKNVLPGRSLRQISAPSKSAETIVLRKIILHHLLKSVMLQGFPNRFTDLLKVKVLLGNVYHSWRKYNQNDTSKVQSGEVSFLKRFSSNNVNLMEFCGKFKSTFETSKTISYCSNTLKI